MVLVTERTFRHLKLSSLLSFLLYTSTQIRVQLVGVTAQPKDAPFYPRADALSAFFFVQSVLQIIWLRRLFLSKANPQCDLSSWTSKADAESYFDPVELPPMEVIVDSLQASFAPYYIVGNSALAMSSILWLQEKFVAAQILCIISVVVQIYAVFMLLSSTGQYSLSRKNWSTHIVAKSSAGLGLLYLWRTWGIIDDRLYPPISELIQTAVICLLLTVASGPDPTLGLCLLYDLVALAYGPGVSDRWRSAYKYDVAIIGAAILIDLVTTKIRGIRIIRDNTSIPPTEIDLKAREDMTRRPRTKLNYYV